MMRDGVEVKDLLCVNWYDATEYCEWLSNATGKSYRLPTLKEWEFAARGGIKSNNYEFGGSNNIDSIAWHSNAQPNYTSVGGKILMN